MKFLSSTVHNLISVLLIKIDFHEMEFFHMNWGWGASGQTGNANGYFLFAAQNNFKMISSIQ